VEVIGLGLDLDEECETAMREIFGQDRLILCRTPAELPQKLGALLRAIYGR
jgi:nitric oxide reductase activation protein